MNHQVTDLQYKFLGSLIAEKVLKADFSLGED